MEGLEETETHTIFGSDSCVKTTDGTLDRDSGALPVEYQS